MKRKKEYLVRYTQVNHLEVRVHAANKDAAETKADRILQSGETDLLTFRAPEEPTLWDITEVV